jgi:hypothetical protein
MVYRRISQSSAARQRSIRPRVRGSAAESPRQFRWNPRQREAHADKQDRPARRSLLQDQRSGRKSRDRSLKRGACQATDAMGICVPESGEESFSTASRNAAEVDRGSFLNPLSYGLFCKNYSGEWSTKEIRKSRGERRGPMRSASGCNPIPIRR